MRLIDGITLLLCASLCLVLLGMGTAVASPAVGRSLAREPLPAQDMDGQHGGTPIAASFVMTYFVAPRLSEGEVCAQTTPQHAAKWANSVVSGIALIWSGRILRRIPA